MMSVNRTQAKDSEISFVSHLLCIGIETGNEKRTKKRAGNEQETRRRFLSVVMEASRKRAGNQASRDGNERLQNHRRSFPFSAASTSGYSRPFFRSQPSRIAFAAIFKTVPFHTFISSAS